MTKNLSDIPANLAGGAAVTIDPMTTRGDLIVRDSTNVTDRLPVGTNGQILKSDGVDVSWDDADSGSGKNYILNPSAAADDTTGVAADTGFSVARTTTASELPEESVGSAFKISGSTLTPGTSKVAFAILASGIDDADGGRFGRAKVSVKDISGTVNGEYSIQVYDVTNSVYVGDSDTITGTGTYYLDVPFIAAGDYEFHLIAQTASPTNIGLSTITIEPVSQTVAGVVGKWEEFTPSWTNVTVGNADQKFFSRIVGDTLFIRGHYIHGSTSSVGGTVILNMPAGYTIDSSKIHGTGGREFCGNFMYVGSSGGFQHGSAIYLSPTAVEFGIHGDSGFVDSTPGGGSWTTGTDFSIIVEVPVLELANAHTPTASDVQYENARMATVGFTSGNSIPNATFTTLDEWKTTETEITAGSFDGEFYTVPADGWYEVNSTVTINDVTFADTFLGMQVHKNGSIVVGENGRTTGTGGGFPGLSVNYVGKFVTGDTISIRVRQDIGVATGFLSNSQYSRFSVARLPDYSARKASLPFSDIADENKQYLLPEVRKETIDMTGSGSFTGGVITVTRNGNLVNITCTAELLHSASGSPASTAILPTWARPDANFMQQVYALDSAVVKMVFINSTGDLNFRYRDWAGALKTTITATQTFSITYNVDV